MDLRRALHRGRDARIIQWEWVGDHALQYMPWTEDHQIVGIFSGRTGADRVRAFVEQHYAACTSTPVELLGYSIDPSANPYPAQAAMNAQSQLSMDLVLRRRRYVAARAADGGGT